MNMNIMAEKQKKQNRTEIELVRIKRTEWMYTNTEHKELSCKKKKKKGVYISKLKKIQRNDNF